MFLWDIYIGAEGVDKVGCLHSMPLFFCFYVADDRYLYERVVGAFSPARRE